MLSLDVIASALRAQSAALAILEQNIANASTAGYTQQVPVMRALGSRGDPRLPAGGGGVALDHVERVRDAFLDLQIRAQLGPQAQQDALGRVYTAVQGILREPGHGGLAQRITGLFAAFASAAAAPGLGAQREQLLSEARMFVSTVQDLADQLGQQRRSLDTEVRTSVVSANGLLEQVAQLNGQIATMSASGGNANQLLDQRDRTLDELSRLTGASFLLDTRGMASVQLGGKALVNGTSVMRLDTAVGTSTGMLNVVYTGDGSTVIPTAGVLAGLLTGRDSVIPGVLGQIDTVVAAVVAKVNAVHRNGFGTADQPTINYVPGAPAAFQGVTLGALPPLRAGVWKITADGLGGLSAVFTPAGGVPEAAVTGRIVAGGTNTSLIPGLILQAPAALAAGTDTVTVTGPARDLFDPAGTTARTLSLASELNGPARLALAAQANSPGDGAIAQRLADLVSALTMSTGTMTYGAYWRDVVSTLGTDASSNGAKSTASTYALDQLRARRESISGVSLDEQGIELVRVQRAYEAAAHVLTVEDRMMGALLGMFR